MLCRLGRTFEEGRKRERFQDVLQRQPKDQTYSGERNNRELNNFKRMILMTSSIAAWVLG